MMKYKIKRYGILIAFVVLIAVFIGNYYSQAAVNRYPNYSIVMQQGDEFEMKDVLLRGTYHENNMTGMNPSVTISVDGSQYYTGRSFIERIDPYKWYGEEIKQLYKDHRQFMRGKRSNGSFYEDNSLVIYANVEFESTVVTGAKNFYFDIDVLDKLKNRTSSYKVALPESKSYRYISVNDVQLFGNELIIVTGNHSIDNHHGIEFHRYSISLAKEDSLAVTDQVIDFYNIEKSNNIQNISDSSITNPNSYQIFLAAERNENNRDIVSVEVRIYDLKNDDWIEINSQEIIDFLNNPLLSSNLRTQLEGDTLTLFKQHDKGVSVIKYNISEEKTELYQIHAEAVTFSQVEEDRVYMLSTNEMDSSKKSLIMIANLKTGEMVYQGTIEVEETSDKQIAAINKLKIHQMTIK